MASQEDKDYNQCGFESWKAPTATTQRTWSPNGFIRRLCSNRNTRTLCAFLSGLFVVSITLESSVMPLRSKSDCSRIIFLSELSTRQLTVVGSKSGNKSSNASISGHLASTKRHGDPPSI